MTMKILFWFDAALLHFGLAKSIQDKLDCELYGIADVPHNRKSFFENQNFVQFSKLWYFHDYINTKKNPNLQYLKSIEEKYGINLWLLAYNERVFFNYNTFYKFSTNEIMNILEDQCKLYETVLQEVNPDCIIMVTNQHHNHLFHEICKAKNIKIIMLGASRLGRKCLLVTDSEKLEPLPNTSPKKFQNISNMDLENFLNKYNSFSQTKKLASEFNFSKNSLIKASMKFIFSKNLSQKTNYPYYGHSKFKTIIIYAIDYFQTKFRLNFLIKNSIKKIPDGNYVYFPLHTEPERTLLLDSPFHTNQLEIIDIIAKSLPIDYKLLVKEHSSMMSRSWRKISFYKNISNHPNVLLVDPFLNPQEILSKINLVVTINGTAGLESAYFGKPTIVFGDVLYSQLSSVTVVKNFETLPDVIKKSLKQKVDLNEVYSFLDYLDQNSFEFDWNGISADELNLFFDGGYLADQEISLQKMNEFLSKHKDAFDLLADEHIIRITEASKK